MPEFKISHQNLMPKLRAELPDNKQFNIAMMLLRRFDDKTDGCLTENEFNTLLNSLRRGDEHYDETTATRIETALLSLIVEMVPVKATTGNVPFKDLFADVRERGAASKVVDMFLRYFDVNVSQGDFKVGPSDMDQFLKAIRNNTEEYAEQAHEDEAKLLIDMESLARSYVELRKEDDASAAGVSHRQMLSALKGYSERNVNLFAEAMLTYDKDSRYYNRLESGAELNSVLGFIERSVRIEGDADDFIAGINIAFTQLSANPCRTPQKDCDD